MNTGHRSDPRDWDVATTVGPMIVWINGAFGVGKTTTANSILKRTNWRLFDPEHVGYLLAGNLRDLNFVDFQDLPPWRALVPAVAGEIYHYTNPPAMIAVQTVLVERYWEELVKGLAERGLPVIHVVLDCDDAEIRRRIHGDEIESQAREWRLDHLARFEDARPWLTRSADLFLDTTALTPEATAQVIINARDRVDRR